MQVNLNDYYVDLSRLFDIVFDGGKKRALEHEITEAYDKEEKSNKLSMVAKTIREVNGEVSDGEANIRYDMVKILLLTAMGLNEISSDTAIEMSTNTLIENNIIRPK